MAENPYKTPVDDRILEGNPPRLARVWKRFLSLIEALHRRLAPEPARLFAGAQGVQTELAPNVWTPLPVRQLISGEEPVSMRIGEGAEQDRLIYDGAVGNNIRFIVVLYFADVTNDVHFAGAQKNGDETTRVSTQVSSDRGEFAAPFIAKYDMEPGDYVEILGMQTGISSGFPTITTEVDAQHTGFWPGNGA